ncbi:MAG: hypothetical protein ACK518_03630 [bacterium]|jgi:hypothetical protein
MISSYCKSHPNYELAYRMSIQPRDTPPELQGNRAIGVMGPSLNQTEYKEVRSACGRKGYEGTNPLLMDSMRGERLILDRPPLESNIHWTNVYRREIDNYGRNYRDYNDINAGQISYWVEKRPEVYVPPIFKNPTTVVHTIMTDPMDIKHPHFERIPIDTCPWSCDSSDCDSFTHDQVEFREQIMASQMRRENERDYKYRVM